MIKSGTLSFIVTSTSLIGIAVYLAFGQARSMIHECEESRLVAARATASSLSTAMNNEWIAPFVDPDASLASVQRTSDKITKAFSDIAELNGPGLSIELLLVPLGSRPVSVASVGDVTPELPRTPRIETAYDLLTDSLAFSVYPVATSIPDLSAYVVSRASLNTCGEVGWDDVRQSVLLIGFALSLAGGLSALFYYLLGTRKRK